MRRHTEDWENCKTKTHTRAHTHTHTHTRTHTHLLSHLSLLRTSPGTCLQVQVVGRHGNCWEWGLFALFLLSSLKPCHYLYSTGTHVYLYAPAGLIVSLSLCQFISLCQGLPSSPPGFSLQSTAVPSLHRWFIHLPHLPLYLLHNWSTTCICTYFVLHPFSINYKMITHSHSHREKTSTVKLVIYSPDVIHSKENTSPCVVPVLHLHLHVNCARGTSWMTCDPNA